MADKSICISSSSYHHPLPRPLTTPLTPLLHPLHWDFVHTQIEFCSIPFIISLKKVADKQLVCACAKGRSLPVLVHSHLEPMRQGKSLLTPLAEEEMELEILRELWLGERGSTGAHSSLGFSSDVTTFEKCDLDSRTTSLKPQFLCF